MNFPLSLSQRRLKKYYGKKIKLLSPAKINLYLNITGKYRDGFHSIESIAERISLFDEVAIEITEDDAIDVIFDDKVIPIQDNLCLKAANLIKRQFNLPFGFRIFLNKNIPIGSGLGGGSSDAAATILGIDKLLGLNLTLEKSYMLGRKIGSDVNFFLSKEKFALMLGKGDRIYPLTGKGLYHVVIWPKINLSTKKVYEDAIVKLTKFFNNVNIIKYALKKGDLPLLKKASFNILEKHVVALSKEVANVKRYLCKHNIFSRVTGSGSALYTIGGRELSNKPKDLLPKKWLILKVQTF